MESKIVEKLYQHFKREVLSEENAKEIILKAQEFGFFSWSYYPGVYTDEQVENKLATTMLPAIDVVSNPDNEHYVYIATRLFEVGGHSRCVLHFIDNLKQAKHTVILTDQRKKLPANLSSFFDKTNTSVISLPASSDPIRSAQMLRQEIISLSPAKIFLFTHPNDLLPLITFGKFHPCEILLFNHADHTFWIRGNWIDTVIDFRETGLKVTRQGRLMNRSALLRLPVSYSYEQVPKENAKMNLGYDEDGLIIGTLTNFSKVQSEKNEISFVQMMLDWAVANPLCTFLIIGLTEAQFSLLSYKEVAFPANLVCLGIIPDPEMYYMAFDFFIEPFPIGSALGIIEACKYGAIPIFSPHPCYLAGSFEAFHETIQKNFSQPQDIDELQKNFQTMINMPAEKINELSETVRELIYQHHRGENWALALKNISLEIPAQDETFSKANIWTEAAYFREYVKEETNIFFQGLLKLKHLVSKKVMWLFFTGRYKVFHFHKLSFKSWKLIVWKTFRN